MSSLRIIALSGMFFLALAGAEQVSSAGVNTQTTTLENKVDALVADMSKDDPASKYAVFKFVYEHRKQLPEERSRALQLLMESAADGYTVAQYNLAILYYYGQWVEKNREFALRWMMMAAKSGMPEAELETGSQLYEFAAKEKSDGQQKLYLANSEYWLRKALSSDEIDDELRLLAKTRLARTITFGDSTNPVGRKMLAEAACAGQEEAISLLKSDKALAEEWAAEGEEQAQKVLASIVDNIPDDCDVLQ